MDLQESVFQARDGKRGSYSNSELPLAEELAGDEGKVKPVRPYQRVAARGKDVHRILKAWTRTLKV